MAAIFSDDIFSDDTFSDNFFISATVIFSYDSFADCPIQRPTYSPIYIFSDGIFSDLHIELGVHIQRPPVPLRRVLPKKYSEYRVET